MLKESLVITLEKAIEVYKTNTSNPKLAGADNAGCKGTTTSALWQPATDHIYYSLPSDVGTISSMTLDGTTFTGNGGPVQATKANAGRNDGNGWIPINFSSLPGGSPISNLPVDPTNRVIDPTSPTSADLVYRYICSEKDLTYEINAVLESEAYTITDNKAAKDGGNNDSYYEAGTNLTLITTENNGGIGGGIVGLDGLNYDIVTGPDGRIWLDRNLGATRVATAYNDSASYGHLYQWGRYADGHQISSSGTTTTLSSSDSPGHSDFIISTVSPFDWRSPQNFNLWLGVSGINNPCPSGFRIPTIGEWQTLITAMGGFTTSTCGAVNNCLNIAYNSALKIPSSGMRSAADATLNNQGTQGIYRSTTSSTMSFWSFAVYPSTSYARGSGFSVRCIKD